MGTRRRTRALALLLVLVGVASIGLWRLGIERGRERERRIQIAVLEGELHGLTRTAWGSRELVQFLDGLPTAERESLAATCGATDATGKGLATRLLWFSSSFFTYPFRDVEELDYHGQVLTWLAGHHGIDRPGEMSSYHLEQVLAQRAFDALWGQMSEEERLRILDEALAAGLTDEQKLHISKLAAQAALAALQAAGFWSATEAMASLTIAAAGLLGIEILGGTVAGIMSGPVGWTFVALSVGYSAFKILGASPEKSCAMVVAIAFAKERRVKQIAEELDRLRS